MSPLAQIGVRSYNQKAMIYSVIPRELEEELYEKLLAHYEGNPDVTVIIDRREGPDRRSGRNGGGKRLVRERRRARIPGTFPGTEAPLG